MLQLMLIRSLAPRAFQLINFLGLTFVCVSFIAIASGMVEHDPHHETQHIERANRAR